MGSILWEKPRLIADRLDDKWLWSSYDLILFGEKIKCDQSILETTNFTNWPLSSLKTTNSLINDLYV